MTLIYNNQISCDATYLFSMNWVLKKNTWTIQVLKLLKNFLFKWSDFKFLIQKLMMLIFIWISNTADIQINNAVIANVGGVGLNLNNCFNVELRNNVFRIVVKETIKTTDCEKVKISQTVITGDSQRGEGWMALGGNSFIVSNTVASGQPNSGIVVYLDNIELKTPCYKANFHSGQWL